ncbi:MAG: Glutamyl-tRNA(Gln) amidotransferase subunit E [Methanomicrobiales archaeon 53_19]|jgi:glutamyl-tRNA(Gln) amidotransferase subunit E|uniref:Glu-tRNA(Gln) amidotransferase subunit GatE n=1 Tax=Methanocalculus sp. TaxID=2004547 RepID=UPI000747BF2E|nr:Glu-tRNA(Gln) amidotransferase subunit GatE [Methanocalculus sp.]KUK68946.1 MAG: Glutamyl-tRNA(Gln) amidotransferase subunit E [Methanocalculus sp. 52_23]KUL04673.1 MAG: Glutamyl-tRNA(Gln) amidotransferase subunit E [Methanomicrobiales archaeon 53_19]HIJ06893.1 Glu-tRNA(Gln) amidotransferase subunit GatE [Methanocalculus sp.]
MDYKVLGLTAGIEIHQQLDTAEKLYCRCPTILRNIDERNGEIRRYLRATVSEMGGIDRAAEEEMKQMRFFSYYAYDTTCLVENDDEPPTPMNPEALQITLTIAKMLLMTPISQVHTMRKMVIDGSNTTGFQRTALVAMNGIAGGDCAIESICLEEEAAQRVTDKTFSLDRLGIPLVEITTAPCMHTPEEVKEIAEYIGMILRSTRKVKRGLGTIRQDVNISIRDGARVEIKGVQELDLIPEVVSREVERQVSLLAIREELRSRSAEVPRGKIDVTDLFSSTKSKVLKKAPCIMAATLKGFAGIVGREIQPGRRLGSEMSDYAKKCGVGGLFHTDELPAYGVTEEEVAALRERMLADDGDCVIIVSGTEEQASCAIRQALKRAGMALEGIPEETRKMLPEGCSAYMRPLPGAARMYPETDVLPVEITEEMMDAIKLPELLTDVAARFTEELGIDGALARHIAYSDRLPTFEKAIAAGIKPALAARTLISTLRELSRDGVDCGRVPDEMLILLLVRVNKGEVAKEALPDILRALAGGASLEEAILSVGPTFSVKDLECLIEEIVTERAEFIRDRGMAALGPVMGVVMKEVRGRIDGQIVADILKRSIEKVI